MEAKNNSNPDDTRQVKASPTQNGAAFQKQYLVHDLQAGVITGVMAIPLSIGIAMMSSYPIKVGLATVAFACFIGWINAWFRPGNYVGTPGIAAGLAPVLALGVATFGLQNMAFIVFLTSLMQAVIWRYNWQRYILQAVPTYLVEGLLAGIGAKIATKFFTFTYELPPDQVTELFWSAERLRMIGISFSAFALFVVLFIKCRKINPAIPYFTLIIGGILLAMVYRVPMIQVEDTPLRLVLPLPDFAGVKIWVLAIGFSAMLAAIDVIEQVMSNAAIEKIDPLKRKCNSNNSLMAIWIANIGSSFFGGMTNLDGLAKSTTNALAGAHTKFSVLIVGIVVSFFVINSHHLELLPKFALAAIMIFTGWKMILGLLHVACFGRYPLMLAILCAILVYRLGIFEGLLLALAVHGVVSYVVYRQGRKHSTKEIIEKFLKKFNESSSY